MTVTELADRRCRPCEGGVEPLDRPSALAQLQHIDAEWQLSADGSSIEREFRFQAFSRTMAFVNAVAWVATIEGHHPRLDVEYGRCQVVYTTNAIGGLSDNDFICAAKIDRLLGDLET